MRVDEADRSVVFDARQLSDDELIVRLKRCVAQDRQLTARLLEHFGEVSARGLYRDQGYPSMFHYAVHSLHMSESEAGLRIRVSRLGREFPDALRMLARGELHMTAVRLLAPVLTQGNVGLLLQARFKTKQQVLELRAKHFPQPDAPARIRKQRSSAMARQAGPSVVQTVPSGPAEASPLREADAPTSRSLATAPGFVERGASVDGPLKRVQVDDRDTDEHSRARLRRALGSLALALEHRGALVLQRVDRFPVIG
jgi:hypothetical protein